MSAINITNRSHMLFIYPVYLQGNTNKKGTPTHLAEV